jgi:HlyD family secretion protein
MSYDASGTFEATEIIVSAQTSGEIEYLNIEEGTRVEAGATLGLVDTTQLHLQKLQLEAGIRAMSGRSVDVALQSAPMEEQIASLERDRSRFENMVKDNAASQKQLDDINTQLAALQKQLAAQTRTITKGNSSVAGEIDGAKAQMAQLADMISKSVITSPISGTILSKYAQAGELAAPGRAIFKVADMEKMFLRAYLTSDLLSGVRIGDKVKVFADSGEDGHREFDGTVSWISETSEFTPKNIQTRNERNNLVYAVKIAVDNTDGYLKSGMYGEVKLSE